VGPFVARAVNFIPGWDRPRSDRVAESVGFWFVRQLGGTTERTMVGLGSRVVSGPAAAELELHCDVFWMDDEERAFDRAEAMDVTWSGERVAQGMRCLGRAAGDTVAAVWRFEAGIAPPRDSLAAVFDSLVAAMSPLIAPVPPMALERRGPDDQVEARYTVTPRGPGARQFSARVRLQVGREDGSPVAIIHAGPESVLDMAPDASSEEKRVLRLVAALLTVPL
jgi:hypothetical protein